MKLQKLFLFLVLFPFSARADFAISKWSEVTQLTDSGKKTVISVEGLVKDLPVGKVAGGFSFGFDGRRNISILEVTSEEKTTKYAFAKNNLQIGFTKDKINGQPFSFKFSYEEKHEAVYPHLREELINIPDFAAGADAKVMIIFPEYELLTFTRNLTRNGHNLTYSTIVPKGGVREKIGFTKESAAWDVSIVINIAADKDLKNLSVRIPQYFRSSRQVVQNYSSTFSASPASVARAGEDTIYNFGLEDSKFEMISRARILTGAKYRKQMTLNTASYTEIGQEERKLLTPLLQKIRSDSKYADLPTYVAIGEFVHAFIKYDRGSLGKFPDLREITEGKIGVCTEYSKLYNGLARLAGIPSLVVNGIACNGYAECMGHSWNVVFYNGSWIEVDPTWNLMSGIVSSSHVYIVDGDRDYAMIGYDNEDSKVRKSIDLKIEKAK